MKKFWLKLVAFALALVLPFAGYFAYVQSYPPLFAGSLVGSIRYKARLAEETGGERILLVGGSSLPYSVECDTVSEAFDMPCINLGATAYLGMELYLEIVRQNLHPGDIVVLAPEFSMYMRFISYSTLWMALENDLHMYRYIPASYYTGLLENFIDYAGLRLSRVEAGMVPEGTPAEQYSEVGGFGPWGDLTFDRVQGWSEGASRGDTINVGPNLLTPEVMDAMNRFYADAQAVGARVYLTWAPFCEQVVGTGEEGVWAFEEALRAQCDIPMISHSIDGIWPRDYFYDSNNHLTREGMRMRTEILVEDLQRALAEDE